MVIKVISREDQMVPTFNKERKETDRSLNVERDSANERLVKDRSAAEFTANETIAQERLEADEARKSQRIDTDSDRKIEGNALKGDQQAIENREVSNERIRSERLAADNAVMRERSNIDSAIETEREKKNELITRLLEKERGETDLNLNTERLNTDAEVLKSSAKLVTEVAAHLQTKSTLTSRDEFLAIVSHDLKNPIGAIASCAALLLEDAIEKKLDAETTKWIQFIKRNAETGLRLINDILDMERVSQGKLQLSFAATKVEPLLREVESSFLQIAQAKEIKLSILHFEKMPDMICDHDRVLQVLSNVVGNAVKFTPQGGKVEISVSASDDCIEFVVADSGSGIPQTKLETIFARFAQIGSADRSGLGLGLYISKMFVEAHQGNIWVDSELSKGSRFHIKLPLDGPSSAKLH